MDKNVQRRKGTHTKPVRGFVRNMGFSTDQSIQIMIWMNLEDLRDMTGSYGSGRITEHLSDIANLIRQ